VPTLSRRTASVADARARTEAALLEATTALLEEGTPFGELGIEVIAKRAGVSRPTFYAYFRDKRELLTKLASEAGESVYAEIGTWLEGDETDLRPTLAAVLKVFRTHRGVVGGLVESATYDPEIAALWRSMHNEFVDVTRDRIRRDQPTLSKKDAEARAFVLVWMTERTCYEHVIAPRVPDAAMVDALMLLWRTGLGVSA
jgi:AcrR family transcriptional regulator